MRGGGHIPSMGITRNARRILARKPEGKRSLVGCKYRWEDNIIMDLKDTGCDDVD
jgi:hypothetical protein